MRPGLQSSIISLQEAIDTTAPGGKLVFHVFAALAEFERDLIHERTAAGLAAARARGRHGGRPSVVTGHKLQVAQEMYYSGRYTVNAIATTLGVSRASVYRHVSNVSIGRLIVTFRQGEWMPPNIRLALATVAHALAMTTGPAVSHDQ
ncbi:MAG TPA: recombinase family protein [Actinomycetota bacterium]|nr:recombinase family protein [Actinomycetota bacterium]